MKPVELSLNSLKSLDMRLYEYAAKLLAAGWSEPGPTYAVTYQDLYQAGLTPVDLRYINLQLVPELELTSSSRGLFGYLGGSPRTSEMYFALNCRLVA